MTEAYIEGYRKTAEEHGVDPAELATALGRPDIGGTYLRSVAGLPPAWHSDLAKGVSNAMRDDSPLGRFLVTLDDKDDNKLTEWTLATDAPKTWKSSDEWKLIAQAAKQMRKNKVKRMLLQVVKSGKGRYFYGGWTGDRVNPNASFPDGTKLRSMYFNAKPITLS